MVGGKERRELERRLSELEKVLALAPEITKDLPPPLKWAHPICVLKVLRRSEEARELDITTMPISRIPKLVRELAAVKCLAEGKVHGIAKIRHGWILEKEDVKKKLEELAKIYLGEAIKNPQEVKKKIDELVELVRAYLR